MKDYLLTLTGPDKTGIVARLAGLLSDRGGNWLDSRMIRLGGRFSGILRISLPEESALSFQAEAEAFLETNGLRMGFGAVGPDDPAPRGRSVQLELSGQDHPGIVHGIFEVFRQAGVNVEELNTGLSIAPWSGTPVFEASARLLLPEGQTLDALQAKLEELAADLMVELSLRAD